MSTRSRHHRSHSSPSPLWIVTREPKLETLVGYLDETRRQLQSTTTGTLTLVFSKAELEDARRAFVRMIRAGERRLHRFCQLLGRTLLDDAFRMESVVVGQSPSTGERFTLHQAVNRRELLRQTDLDLGNQHLSRFRVQTAGHWEQLDLIANFVEYEAMGPNGWGLHKIISRIKAEEELWNKVADELFEIDTLVRRDKQLRHLSRFVKDVFGVKCVATSQESARELHEHLTSTVFDDEHLHAVRVTPDELSRRLRVLETKDYLVRQRAKASGWRALKTVAEWSGVALEIQIQPLRNFYRERERLSQESHSEFKSRRESLRDRIAVQEPLFGFYRDLLQWLFVSPDSKAPRFRRVRVELTD